MEVEENRKKTVIKQLTAVHSYVIRQKNDAKDTVLLSELENILLSPYFMSGRLEPSLSATELLLWLSVWRTGFELCDQFKTIPEWKLKHLFDVLRNNLLSSNKYVMYETQKVYVAVLQKLKLQFVIEDIASNIGNVSTETLRTVLSYAEVCRDLLSKHNPHALLLFDHISQSLLNYISFLFQNRSHAKFHDNLYLLILIQIKIVKLICLYQHETASKYIIKVINTHGTNLVDIIFDCVIQNGFIWKKACEMWFRILSLLEVAGFEHRKGILRCFASSIVNKMLQFGVFTLFPGDIRTENGKQPKLGFTGSELPRLQGSTGIRPDCVRLVEGCRLTLKACECLIVNPGGGREARLSQKKSYTVLSSLDTFLKEVLSCDIEVPFHWLPQVFGDQDDSWIEALLMLLNIALQGQLWDSNPPVCLQQHHYFRQFVAGTGYDHSVLVDLLTSPETCFLSYFTRYLKYSLTTWEDFVKEQKYCPEPHKVVLSQTEANGVVRAHDTDSVTDGGQVHKDSKTLVIKSGSSDKNINDKYVEYIKKDEKLCVKAVYSLCDRDIENQSNDKAGVHDHQSVKNGSSNSDEELPKTDKFRTDQMFTESVVLCSTNGLSNAKVRRTVNDGNIHKLPVTACTEQKPEPVTACTEQKPEPVTACTEQKPESPEQVTAESLEKEYEFIEDMSCSTGTDVSKEGAELHESFKEENIDIYTEFSEVEDHTSLDSVFQSSELCCENVETRKNEKFLEEQVSLCMCNTEKPNTSLLCSEKRPAGTKQSEESNKKLKLCQDSYFHPDLKNKHITQKEKQNCSIEKEKVETGNVEDSFNKSENTNSYLESVEFVEETQSRETIRLLSETDGESVLITEREGSDTVSFQNLDQQADNDKDTFQLAETLQTNDKLQREPGLCSNKTDSNVTKESDSIQYCIQAFQGNVSSKASMGKCNKEYMLDSNIPVITKEDYAAISNDLDSVELFEEAKSKETQTLEAGQSKEESLLLTEGEEFESLTFENVVDKEKAETCKTDKKRKVDSENFEIKTDMAAEIDKELENIEFEEVKTIRDNIESKLVNYEIDDLDNLSDVSNLDSSIEFSGHEEVDSHSKSKSELYENSVCQIDDVDYQIEEVAERTCSDIGLVDYVMSDEDETMILNELKSDSNNPSIIESSLEYKESTETDNCSDSLDTLMGVLIRVRMKLEKLKSANILQYNPQPLLKLLNVLEDKYESV